MGAFTACNIKENEESADLGLNIKVFAPTKVVTGTPMTISGSGFTNATTVVFPENVSVTSFQVVSDGMIRVTVPAGLSENGGQIVVRSANEEAVSSLPLTIGHPTISGYSKQPGESVSGGEMLTIYGKDLEFITSVEMLDADGNPVVIPDSQFYRKGTSTVIIIVPKKVFKGSFAGKVNTQDGKQFMMPELAYEPAAEGGHWEMVRKPFWENAPDGPAVSWSGTYRFALEGHDSAGECIAELPQSIWDRMMSEPFYLVVKAEDPQIRVTNGWWDTNWKAGDLQPGNELLEDNGDGTFTATIDLSGDPDFVATLLEKHILFTGDRFTPVSICFDEEEWVEGGGEGHWEIVKKPFWENAPDGPAVGWSSDYRFALEGHDGNNECIAEFPQDIWDRMLSETFYLIVKAEDPQIRVTNGWWDTNWNAGDLQPGNELLTDNGDGTFTATINLTGDSDFVATLLEKHILFTGDRFTPVSLCFDEEEWVAGGGSSGPAEVLIWNNDDPAGNGSVAWSGVYRFSSAEGTTGEEIYAIPMDVWEKMKTTVFYLQITPNADWYNVRLTNGWWDVNWKGGDIGAGNELMIDNGDGTYYIGFDISDDADFLATIDQKHILFTGEGFTPLKLYFLE